VRLHEDSEGNRSVSVSHAAVEQYTQARDLAAAAQSDLYPHWGAGGELSDNRQSVNRLFRGSQTTPNVQASNEVLASRQIA